MTQPNNSFEDTEMLILTLLESAALVEKRLDGALSMIRGISFSEYRLLRSLAKAHAGVAMRVDLAKTVGLTPSAVTRALKPLEKLGYVTTEKSERDARRSLATLTAAGTELLEDAYSLVEDVTNEMPLTSLDFEQLMAFRNKLTEKTVTRSSRKKRL